MSEPNFDVEAAEKQYNEAREEQQQDLPLMDVEEEGSEDDPPPGFKSYEDYVAQGGDPDMYRGKKAYEAEHTRIDENKTLRREIKGLKGTVQQTMDAVSEWQTTERDKMKRELEGELHTAKENEDVNAAIDVQQRLDKLNETPKAAPPAPEHPVIQSFRDNHPQLDAEAAEFNEEFNDDVEAFYNGMAQQLSHQGRKQLSDGQIKRCLAKAMRDAQELHGENEEVDDDNPAPKESPRNQRKRGTPRARRQPGTRAAPTTARAEDFKIENPKNGRDTTGAAVRDMIRDKAYQSAKKSGKTDADATTYASQETKRFEESLAR